MKTDRSASPRRLPGLALLALAGLSLAPSAPAGSAGPSVAALLAACDRAAAHGGRGVDAALCEWYAAPCACKPDYRGAGAEPWCVPPDESIDATLARVLVELRRVADPTVPAEPAVAQALRRLYPCPATP